MSGLEVGLQPTSYVHPPTPPASVPDSGIGNSNSPAPEQPKLMPFMETAAAKQLVADIAETEKLTEALREGVIEADGARRSAIQAHNALRQALGELRAQAKDEDGD